MALAETSRGRNGGTWGQPKLAVFFARWLDVRSELVITKPAQAAVAAAPQNYLESVAPAECMAIVANGMKFIVFVEAVKGRNGGTWVHLPGASGLPRDAKSYYQDSRVLIPGIPGIPAQRIAHLPGTQARSLPGCEELQIDGEKSPYQSLPYGI